MTKEKLIQLIREVQNNYKQGENLSKDDLYKIGLAHRHLPKSERSWSWLLSITGGFVSSEAYRNYVLSRLRKNNFLEDVEDSTGLKSLDDYTIQKNELFKERQKLRDERTSISRMLRDEARVEELKKAIVENIKYLKELPNFKNEVKTNLGNCEAILMLSDWHIGQESDNFYNKFNIKIAKERVEKIIDDTIDYCNKFNVNTLHILNLGDLIEGIINTNARIEQTQDSMSQLMIATEIMAQALNKLQAHVSKVTYRSVVDNHSRVIADKHQSIAKDNFNRITDWYLEERLKNTKIVFMKDNLDIGLGRFTLKNGMKVAFMHGHEDQKDKMLQNLVGATHEWTDIVCMGHLHNPAEHVYQDMRLFINGSLCGTGPYALSHRLFTKPSQKLIIVDNNNYINIDVSVNK